jgi:hypothetical protein
MTHGKFKKVFKKIVLKIDGASSSSIFNSFRLYTWHNTNMPCGILKFWSK